MATVHDPGVEHVYHWRRPDLRGDVLHPLNTLAASHPDVYRAEVATYAGREHVLSFRIPHLDVLWNDVAHTSTVHPHVVHLALAERGYRQADLPPGLDQFFRIPIRHLEGIPMVWYAADDLSAPAHSFRPFEPERYHELRSVTPAYLAHLRQCRAEGTRPLLYFTVPHVLVAGPIPVAGLEVVDWREPMGPPP